MKASQAPFMAFFMAMISINDKIRTVSFWNAQARWQQAWLEHCDYHGQSIARVTGRAAPGWRVLDIGAGSGVLSLPLRQRGCEVTALEPSRGMRALLRQAVGGRRPAGVTIDGRSWEKMPVSQAQGFQLILACNSLHLTSLGFGAALEKIFQARPRHICVISETRYVDQNPPRACNRYRLSCREQFLADSSVAYRSLTEAWEHFEHHWGRLPTSAEKIDIAQELEFRDSLYWLRQESLLTLWWWTRLT